jgi:IS5 family transposase
VAYGGKGKGILIHLFTEGNGMPISGCTTPANGDERQQVLSLSDKIKIRMAGVGRPKKRFKVLAADKGYEAKWLRQALRKRGIRGQIAKRHWRGKNC